MFTFKQFSVKQDRCAMKVGTDGVLLGAWAPSQNSKRTLDIGTGTGLIALMLAQRSENSIIDAIEIDESAAQQAKENVADSPFENQINIIQTALQDFKPKYLYNHIVSNPPYFINSFKNPDLQRNTARHTDTLSFEDLIINASRLLEGNGYFSVIIPNDSAEKFIQLAEKSNLYLNQYTKVYPTSNSTDPKRALLCFTKTNQNNKPTIIEDSIAIEIARHQYTPEYIQLTKQFYLKM